MRRLISFGLWVAGMLIIFSMLANLPPMTYKKVIRDNGNTADINWLDAEGLRHGEGRVLMVETGEVISIEEWDHGVLVRQTPVSYIDQDWILRHGAMDQSGRVGIPGQARE